ncbi:MAG: hypothetical protein ABIK65_04250 [Candidatus Eisenbacteria bacterium]
MRIAKTLLALATVSLVMFLFGCGENSPTDSGSIPDGEENVDLNAEFGGYEATDEAAAFGMGDLEKMAEDGVEAHDQVAEESEVVALGAAPATNVYVLRLAWGMLEGDSSVTVETDWSGSISVDRGAVIVERVIRFEPGDYVVRPRTDRTVVDLVSKTAPHWDGLLITLLDPAEDSLAQVENVLRISLGGFETSYTTVQLAELEEIIDVDLTGNQFSVNAFLVDEFPCGRGFLSGEWRHTNVEGGDFRGRWSSYDGENRGFVRGQWGLNEEGRKVFFGKYIFADGAFGGLLRGHWGFGESRGSGFFRGAWHGENEIRGLLHGVWRHEWRGPDSGPNNGNRPGETLDRGRGFFHGRWFRACDPSEVTDEFQES